MVKIISWTPNFGVGAPLPSGESWIYHCKITSFHSNSCRRAKFDGGARGPAEPGRAAQVRRDDAAELRQNHRDDPGYLWRRGVRRGVPHLEDQSLRRSRGAPALPGVQHGHEQQRHLGQGQCRFRT